MDRLLHAFRAHAGAMDNALAQPRIAVISSFDPASHAVRVRVQPEDVLSGWIPMSAVGVGNGVGVVIPPSPGDQVLVVPQEGDSDAWHVVGRMFHDDARAPVSAATDKPVMPGEVGIFCEGAFIHISGGVVHIRAATLKTEGRWEHKGDLAVEGDITATEDVTAATISLRRHLTRGVQPGNGESGEPKP